ncbi:MAG: signal peptidase II [Patescibacteria group bacterium]|jgi:lipoprotein signal peptidase
MYFKTLFRYVLLGGVFLISDRFLKWQAAHNWIQPLLIGKNFGWEPFYNKGIAFGIVMPKFVVVALTVFIIAAVLYFFYLNEKTPSDGKDRRLKFGLVLILVGAFSNLADRLVYNHTIDYIRIFNGVINLADIFIVVGFVLYFSSLKQENTKT